MPSARTRVLACLAALVLGIAPGCGYEEKTRGKNFDGPWARHTIDDAEKGADGVRVADVNGDGLPDVATGWEQQGVTRAYLHPGYAAVKEPWPAVTVGRTGDVEDAVWVDIDGDGQLDVVSSCEGATRKVFVNFAPSDPSRLLDPSAWDSEAIPATEGHHWMYAVPMDVDHRNGIDLVVGSKRLRGMIAWLESPPDPRDMAAWKLHEISPAGWVMSLDVLDMNGDGIPDVLVSDRTRAKSNGVRWLERPSDPSLLDGLWINHDIGAKNRNPTFIAPVRDGDAPPAGIVVPSGARRLTLFERMDAGGIDWNPEVIPYPHHVGNPKSAAVGDIDLDGIPDVVVACTNLKDHEQGIVWISHAAEPGDSEPVTHDLSGAQGSKYDRVELLDLDGDGDLDVLTTEEIEGFGVVWYENPLR